MHIILPHELVFRNVAPDSSQKPGFEPVPKGPGRYKVQEIENPNQYANPWIVEEGSMVGLSRKTLEFYGVIIEP